MLPFRQCLQPQSRRPSHLSESPDVSPLDDFGCQNNFEAFIQLSNNVLELRSAYCSLSNFCSEFKMTLSQTLNFIILPLTLLCFTLFGLMVQPLF